MKTKKIIFASLMTISLAVGVTCLLANNKKGLLGTVKADTEYQFVLDGDNAPASYGENVSVVSTKKGNALKFNYVGASASTNNHMALTAGGYIQNVEELLDLTTLTVVGTGSFKLHTGFEGYSHIEAFEISSSSKVFDLTNTAYFKLEAVTNSVITSITGDYSCTEISYPTLVKGSNWNQAASWNVLVHDLDPHNEFEFEFSMRWIYTGSDRVQRPRFFIYNADDLYDENFAIQTTSGYCKNSFYQIRADSYHTTMVGGTNTEKAIGNADSWLSASTGAKNAVNYGDNTNFNNATKDAVATYTMSLVNTEGGGQKFTCVLFIDTNVEGKNDITITYTITRDVGIIFDATNIGMAIGIGNWSALTTFDLLSTSSSGVR